ncbi:MAG: hypothetical protein CVU31_17945 [Betaproteobacteria bacterium HGW-Betaproteobacteria-4]|jgi:hypothetical protein|nr:MAG: hypothetical protein CVU31_17945 [Betaproteobacteria bacterium HGW-Betaproteobacteria-4]
MLFSLGQIVMTRGIADLVAVGKVDVLPLVSRHATGDWGELDAQDKQLNDDAVTSGGRIFSCYCQSLEVGKVWIITEWDRSYTTVLLPDEY